MKAFIMLLALLALLVTGQGAAGAEDDAAGCEPGGDGVQVLRMEIDAKVFLENLSTHQMHYLGRTGPGRSVVLPQMGEADYWLIEPVGDVSAEALAAAVDEHNIPGVRLPQSAGDDHLELLGKCRSLRVLAVTGSGISDEGLKHLSGHQRLEGLAISGLLLLDPSGPEISDDGLRHFRTMPRLKQLAIRGRIGDEGVRHIAECGGLETLSLLQTQVTSRGLQFVGKLEGLQELFLAGNKIGSDGLIHLRGLKKLRVLSVGEEIPGDDLAHLTAMMQLEELYLPSTISDRALRHLPALRNLKIVHLGHSGAGDEAFEHLSKLPELRELLIINSGTRITATGIAHLAKMKKLRSLTLLGLQFDATALSKVDLPLLEKLIIGDEVGDEALRQLLRGGKVRQLVIGFAITDAGMEAIGKLRELEELQFAVSQPVTDEGFRHLSNCKKLRVLPIPDAVTEQGIAHLRGLTNIEEFRWRNPATDSLIENLKGWKRLKKLTLYEARDVTDVSLAIIGQLTCLEEVVLNGAGITDDGMSNIANLSKLRVLEIAGTKVTGASLKHLRDLAELEELNISGMSITDKQLQQLCELRQLRRLRLIGATISDKHYNLLTKLSHLDYLNICGTKVSRSVAQQLKITLPRTQVIFSRE